MEITEAEPAIGDLAETFGDPPRKYEQSFYFVLLIVVLVWSAVPLSWIFVVYALRTGSIWTFAWRGRTLFALALCEVFFSVYHYRLARDISRSSPDESGNLPELQTAFRRVLQSGLSSLPEDGADEEEGDRPGSPAEEIIALEYSDPRAVDFRNYIRTWFGKVPWSSIRRQEVYAWLHWSVFNTRLTSLDALPLARQNVLHESLEMLEKRAGITIPEGTNPAVRPILLTIDPVTIAWRPLFWYVSVAVSNYCLRRWFEANWGAKFATYNDLEYFVHIPAGWTSETGPRPIVFMHGLGLGLTQYKIFLTHLLDAVPDHPVLVPLHPHVSQEFFHPRYLRPMTRHESAACLAGLLKELGWVEKDTPESEKSKPASPASKGVTLFSHSNGSFAHAWMLKQYPEMVSRSIFVDPVTFCSWEGDLCYNFLYRPCRTGLELGMKYFVGTELGVANFLQRYFDWSSNALWFEEIPNACDPAKTMFFLGGQDDIFDARRVKRYLTSHGIRKGLRFDPQGRHGEALIAGGEGHIEIMRWLREDDR